MLNVKKIRVNKKLADGIENLLLDGLFDWYYNPTTSYDVNHKEPDTFQFTHQFYKENEQKSGALPAIIKLFREFKLGDKKFRRIKANFTTNNVKAKTVQHIHQDMPKLNNTKSLLYYVNDSDGDTIFYDNNKKEVKRIKPKKGLGILFDSNTYHAGSNPIKSNKRVVINYIFYE